MNLSSKVYAAVTAVLLTANCTAPFARAEYRSVPANLSYDTELVIYTEETTEPPTTAEPTETVTEEKTEESWEYIEPSTEPEPEPSQDVTEEPTEPSTTAEPTETETQTETFEPTEAPSTEPAPTEATSAQSVLKLTEYSQTAKLNVNYDGEIIWLSGDSNIVTVKDGVVTAIGNGSTVIYAVCGDSRAETPVTVEYDYYLDDTELTLIAGNQAQLALHSANTKNLFNPLAVWTSSDADVLTVDNEGILTAISAGTAEITAKIGDITRTCTVTVNPAPAQAEISVGSAEIKVGNQSALSVTNYDGSVTWISSDTDIITVTQEGVITGIKAGTAKIYAMLGNGKTLSYEFTVTASEILSGDVDLSGKVDIMDVILLNKALFGKASLNEEQAHAADVNHDDKPDFSDSLTIMRYIVKLIDTLS